MNSLARTLQKSIQNFSRPDVSKDELALGGYELVRVFERRTDAAPSW